MGAKKMDKLLGQAEVRRQDDKHGQQRRLATTAAAQKIAPLTSLRGIAATMVMFFHLRYAFVDVSAINLALFDIRLIAKGYLWVDCFFILSGFVLAHRYGGGTLASFAKVRSFIWQRFVRIYPLQLVTLATFAAYIGTQNGWAYLREQSTALVANALLIHNWGLVFMEGFNYPSWSLSAEWAAYLLFPILSFAVAKVTRRMLPTVILCMILITTFFAYVHFKYGGSMDITYGNGWIRCLFSFTLGLALCPLSQQLRGYLQPVWFEATAIVVGILTVVGLHMEMSEFLFVPLSAFGILALSYSQGPVTRLLQSAPLVYLGEISFSVYMWHALVGRLFKDAYTVAGRPEWGRPAAILIFISLALVVFLFSAVSYHLIETRLGDRLRRFFPSENPTKP